MYKFEPFQKVLVRCYAEHVWRCNLYSHRRINSELPHECVWGAWKYCIPYEGNEHLLGTTGSHTPKHEYKWGDKVEVRPNSMWVKALYHFEEVERHKHKVFGRDVAYGDLSHFEFNDHQIRPLAEDSNALQK